MTGVLQFLGVALLGGLIWLLGGLLVAVGFGKAMRLLAEQEPAVDVELDDLLIERIAAGEDVEADSVSGLLCAWRDEIR